MICLVLWTLKPVLWREDREIVDRWEFVLVAVFIKEAGRLHPIQFMVSLFVRGGCPIFGIIRILCWAHWISDHERIDEKIIDMDDVILQRQLGR